MSVVAAAQAAVTYPEFPIPMRGNEHRPPALVGERPGGFRSP